MVLRLFFAEPEAVEVFLPSARAAPTARSATLCFNPPQNPCTPGAATLVLRRRDLYHGLLDRQVRLAVTVLIGHNQLAAQALIPEPSGISVGIGRGLRMGNRSRS